MNASRPVPDVVAPGMILLSGIVGSTAYGLARQGSDVDRLGIYAAPTRQFHGLDLPIERRGTVIYKAPDFTLHEARKVMLLLLRSNPTVTELLWLPDDLHETRTPWGEQLLANRDRLLCGPRVVEAYLGYAQQQLGRLHEAAAKPSSDRGRAEKYGRHLVRLLEQARQLHTTATLTVRVADPVQCYVSGRELADNPAAGQELLAATRRELAAASTPLPPVPDLVWANDWLLRLREDLLTRP